jgi:GNAT superfamily N-acetyltransferase
VAAHNTPVVRRAIPEDAPAILTLVDALADYEKLDRPDAAARERLVRDLFGWKPRIDCWLAFVGGTPAGYAFALETYSSFLALPTMYLEDLFVLPQYRSRKAGYALFSEVLAEARRRGCGRMEWTVLDWNQLAIDFYRRLGGEHLKEWHLYRIRLGGRNDGGH